MGVFQSVRLRSRQAVGVDLLKPLVDRQVLARVEFDYQSDRHCAKTVNTTYRWSAVFDYQSNRHCAKTWELTREAGAWFDYQSDRHCAKTSGRARSGRAGLITSRIDTAPKLSVVSPPTRRGRALLDVAPFIDCARRCAPYLYHEKTGSKRLIVAQNGSLWPKPAQTGSKRLIVAHHGPKRPHHGSRKPQGLHGPTHRPSSPCRRG